MSWLGFLVVHESKDGNTRLVEEKIVEGFREVESTDAPISEVKEVNFGTLGGCDVILIGSPNHVGGPMRGVRKFIDKLGKLKLGEKGFAVFDTREGL